MAKSTSHDGPVVATVAYVEDRPRRRAAFRPNVGARPALAAGSWFTKTGAAKATEESESTASARRARQSG
jgi:hypothetical protein